MKIKIVIKENIQQIPEITVRGEKISFIIEGGSKFGNPFMIRAYNQQKMEVGNMNVIPWKSSEESIRSPQNIHFKNDAADANYTAYFVKYIKIDPKYRKQTGDVESIAKVFYSLAKQKAKSLGAAFFASDSRLSPDSLKNWKNLEKNKVAYQIKDPKSKGGVRYVSKLENDN